MLAAPAAPAGWPGCGEVCRAGSGQLRAHHRSNSFAGAGTDGIRGTGTARPGPGLWAASSRAAQKAGPDQTSAGPALAGPAVGPGVCRTARRLPGRPGSSPMRARDCHG